MNRRLRSLLTRGLLGAVASVVINLGRRRMRIMGRKNLRKRASRPLRMAMGRLGRVALEKWLPLRRRVR